MNQFQSLEEILGVIRRRFWIMALIVLVGCGISLYVALNQDKVYEATSVIQIEAPEVTDSLAGAAVRSNDTLQRVKLVEQRIMSRDNLIKVIEKYDLFNEDGEDSSVNERVNDMRGAINMDPILTTAQAWIPGGVPSALVINVQLGDPEKARDVANDLMYGVIEESRARSIEQAQGALELFNAEETRVSTEIEALEAQIAEFKRTNAQYLSEGLTVLREELGNLNESSLSIDQQIATLRGSQRTRGEVAEQSIQLLQDQQQIIQSRIAEINNIIATAPAFERDLNALERELKRKQDQFTVVTTRKAEAEIGQLLEESEKGSRFEVLETALLPESPVNRSRRQIAMMGGVASVLAAMFAAVLLELLNPALRTPAQMERALGMTPVVSVPRVTVKSERRRRRLLQAGGLAAVLMAIPVAFKYLTNRNGVDVPR